MAGRIFSQARAWLERASQPGDDLHALRVAATHDDLPDWLTSTRSQAQVVGMREALETLRTWIAAELVKHSTETRLLERLAGLDGRLEQVALLWIERPPAELRRGVGYSSLTVGLDEAYRLGAAVAALA